MRQMHPEIILAAAIGESAAGHSPTNALIEAEHTASAAILTATELPSDMGNDRPIFEAWGIVFGEQVPGDPLFIQATLPAGWTKTSYGDNGYGFRVLDDKGRARISIFYKGAFWDRRASMHALRRYSVEYANEDFREVRQWGAFDGKTLLWASERLPKPSDAATREERLAHYDKGDALRVQAIAWLDEHKPNWKDPLAYWDEE